MKKLIKLFIAGLILLTIGCVASYYMFQRYLNSPAFPEDLSEMASKELKGELEITDFTLEGRDLSSSQISLKNSGKIKEIKIEELESSFGKWAILRRKWIMRTLECNKLHVHIGKKKKPELTSKKSAPPADNSKNSADRPLVKKDTKEKKAPLYEKLIPNEVEFSKLQVNTFSGLVERKKGNDISWDDVEMHGSFNDDTINMTLVGGQLKVPLEILPKWTIINAEVIVNEDTYEVKNANLSLEKGGSAVLSGGGDIEGGNISAVADLKAIPIESLIENSEHAEIKGFINGEVKVVSENDETVTKGTLTLNEGALTVPKIANPVLRFLEINDGNEIQLDQCTADITHIDDLTIFENLDISVARTYKVRGNARLDDDTYTLRCHLGISPELHVRLPDNLAAKYEQKGSFYWISINESGNKDDIAIDLSKKAASALAASFLGDSDVFDKIGDALGEEVKDFLNGEKGEKLKKEGLKALENLFR